MRSRSLLPLLLIAVAPMAGAAEATPGAWDLPAEGSCVPEGGLSSGLRADDVAQRQLQNGDLIGLEDLPGIRRYLPPELWEQRELFFFEGMQLEIGPCFRDYGAPGFVASATERFRGQPRLLENGGLQGYTAGVPFPPESIAAEDPRVGLAWAWNVEHRYQAGGFRGQFRITDILGPGRSEPFEGEIFKAQLRHRADRPADGYAVPDTGDRVWAAGGSYAAPFDLREIAWRQYRALDSASVASRTDELHLYVPDARRVRRIPAPSLDGLYTPSASVLVSDAPGHKSDGKNSRQIEPRRSGFDGLELRPLLYRFEVRGVQDVITPINARRAAFPEDPGRSFGPSGLSWASDRWDLRRALILEGSRRDADAGAAFARFRFWVDLQTLQPLYYTSYDAKGGLVQVGLFVGRWSEDRPDYPRWPDAPPRPVRVVDTVGAAFVNLATGAHWRRESWSMVSAPEDDRSLRREISLQTLQRRR